MSNKAIDKDYLLTQLKNFDSKILSETYLNQANIWEGTAEELETQQSSIPNESLLLVNNDGMGGVVLDAELSTTSENAIQNKAVATAINTTNGNVSTLSSDVSGLQTSVGTINTTLATTARLSDTISTASDTPRDADTLEGHPASYYGTASAISSLNDSLNAITEYTVGDVTFKKNGKIVQVYKQLDNISSGTNILVGILPNELLPSFPYVILPLYNIATPYTEIGTAWIYSNGQFRLFKPTTTTTCFICGTYMTL